MMLQLAHWFGCSPIYLLGMVLSYHVPDHADGTVITSREADVNHFHPAYFGPGKRWHPPRVDRMQKCLARAFETLAARGVQVFNATRGGNLQGIERAKYEDVFER